MRPILMLIALVPTATACNLGEAENLLDVPIEVDYTFDTAVDVGAVTGRAAGQPAPEAVSYPVTLPPVEADLASQSSELASNKSKLQRVELTEIRVVPGSNTLTTATPPIDLYIGPAGATSTDDAVKIATIPPISSAPVTAAIDQAGQDAAQPYLLSLDFNILAATTISVDKGETVPGGRVDLQITLGVKATVNPVK